MRNRKHVFQICYVVIINRSIQPSLPKKINVYYITDGGEKNSTIINNLEQDFNEKYVFIYNYN